MLSQTGKLMTPLIILMYALFASTFSTGKILLDYCSPILLVAIRMIPAGLILVLYHVWRHERLPHYNKKDIYLFAQIVVIGMWAAYSFRFWGLKYLPSAKTALLYNVSPFFTSIYSYLFFNEKMTRKQWFGLTIGFFGMIPILLSTSAAEQKIGEFFYISWPELAVLTAAALQSYGWIVVRTLVRERHHSPSLVNGISMLFGGILSLITAPLLETFIPMHDLPIFLGWLTYVVIVSNIICSNLYGYLLKHYSATFVAFAGFVLPIFAALYGWGFLNEQITWHFYTSCTIFIIGLYLFYQDELKGKMLYAE